MYEFYKIINTKGLRFPKIIIKDNTTYLFGGILRKENNDIIMKFDEITFI